MVSNKAGEGSPGPRLVRLAHQPTPVPGALICTCYMDSRLIQSHVLSLSICVRLEVSLLPFSKRMPHV